MCLDLKRQLARVLCVLLVASIWLGARSESFALTLAGLNPARTYRVKGIVISGNKAFSDDQLLGLIETARRPWYQFWKKRPPFEPDTFRSDLDRLRRFYQSRGYYNARVTYDLTVEGDLVTARIKLVENQPVRVDKIAIKVKGPGPPPERLEPALKLPLREGEVFDEGAYQLTQQNLRDLYMEKGYAHAKVQRRAVVRVGPNRARVRYTVEPGVRAVFGSTIVVGTRHVKPEIVLRELTYREGERFSPQKIESSRKNILALNLFSSVRFNLKRDRARPGVVPVEIQVHEKPPRRVSIGLGYNTETLFNAGLQWQHYNFLGGGRQLSLAVTYSSVASSLEAKLVQPHLFSRGSRGVLEAQEQQQVYQTYTLTNSRLRPRIEDQFSPSLSWFFGYRLEYLKFNSVSASTIAALGGIRRQGILSGPYLGVILNTTDNPFSPQHGVVLSFRANQAGEIWGGDYRYFKLQAEARDYHLIGWRTVLATRLKIGLADTFGPHRDIPLSERFYSGGEGSVRGYGLRRIGPLSTSNDPLGGLSLVEGSVELRRPIWDKLSGAVFFDFGQVSTHSFDLPVDALRYGYGPSLAFATPVGLLRIDLGFPSRAPRGDSNWQLYFSIGQFF